MYVIVHPRNANNFALTATANGRFHHGRRRRVPFLNAQCRWAATPECLVPCLKVYGAQPLTLIGCRPNWAVGFCPNLIAGSQGSRIRESPSLIYAVHGPRKAPRVLSGPQAGGAGMLPAAPVRPGTKRRVLPEAEFARCDRGLRCLNALRRNRGAADLLKVRPQAVRETFRARSPTSDAAEVWVTSRSLIRTVGPGRTGPERGSGDYSGRFRTDQKAIYLPMQT